ncbi:hypothetical protein C8R43DRAFT_1136623 [Mycena crocata]|nr:hypothetical protein C8R43DRAFT_1136623 [Mycena crocata]
MANTFFFMRDLFIMEFIMKCDLVTIFTLSQTGQYARDLVKAFFSCNLRLLVALFVGDAHVDTFFTVLELSLSGIGGSTATSVLTFPYRHKWKPTNLNIFLPRGYMFVWRDFLDSIGLAEAAVQHGVSPKHAHTTHAHVVYETKLKDFTIALTESLDESILTILTGATTTFCTNIWTCSDVYIMYMKLATEKRALEGWFPTSVRSAVKMHRRGYRSSISTTSWNEPCGINCPTRRRYLNTDKDVAFFRWGGLSNQHGDNTSTIGIPVFDVDRSWRLGDIQGTGTVSLYSFTFGTTLLFPLPHPRIHLCNLPVMSYAALYSRHRSHATTLFPQIDFEKNHPLSTSQRTKLASLMRLPYGPKWASFLSTLDFLTLFKFSLESRAIFRVVMQFVRANDRPPPRSSDSASSIRRGPLEFLANVPTDIFPLIFSGLTLRDVLHLSWTSPDYHPLFARELQTVLTSLLSSFGLVYDEVRFMQTATLAVISGSTVARLLDSSVKPSNIDFYCPKPAYPWVGRFFEIATRYRPALPVGGSDRFEGIAECLQWHLPDMRHLVNIFCSESDSALECATYFPFSHLMAAITHYGVWFAYPSSSTKLLSMPNRDLVDASTPANRLALERLVKKYLRRGYSFVFNPVERHVCGAAYECPTTVRTTVDNGCLELFFPSHPFGAPFDPDHVYPLDRAVSWSLNGGACSNGEQALRGGIRPRANNEYVWWRARLESVLAECVASGRTSDA